MKTRRCMLYVFLALVCFGRARGDEKDWVSEDGRFALKKMNEDNDYALVR